MLIDAAAWCGVCEHARRSSAAHRIPSVDKDIDAAPGAREDFRQLGEHGVPRILVHRHRRAGRLPANLQRTEDAAE